MYNSSVAPDSILNSAKWSVNSSNFTLSSITGKSINITYIGRNPRCGSGDRYTLQATIGNITTTSSIYIPPSGYITSNMSSNESTNKSSNENITSSTLNSVEENITKLTDQEIDEIKYYEYDNNNNLVAEKNGSPIGTITSSYEYDELNQLIKLTNSQGTTSYTYNPAGLRNSKTQETNKTGYYYDGDNVIIETINNNFAARNIMGINPIARETGTSKLYYLYNGHADVVAMVDAAGAVVNSYSYDIYGNIVSANETGGANPIRYAGQYYDNESEMYYLRARYYDPELMRFISEDSYKGDVKDPLSLNLYVYCTGNPIRYIDPSGYNIEFSSEMTEEQKKQYEEALKYLNNSKQFEILYKTLVESEKTIIIEFTDKLRETGYYPDTNILCWNPLEGLVLSDEESVQSPALGLAHEMGHAYQDLYGLKYELDRSGTKRSEKNNLKLWEIPIAKELGEPIRKF